VDAEDVIRAAAAHEPDEFDCRAAEETMTDTHSNVGVDPTADQSKP